MKRIGIYGGTFNPPHIGHIAAAAQAIETLALDRLLLIPDRVAPHKQMPEDSASPRQRLEMLEIAAQSRPEMVVSDIELQREGPSYTYQTVEALRRGYPDGELYLLMGTDMFLSFHSWRHPERIWQQVTLTVLYRGEKGEVQQIREEKARWESLGARVRLVENCVTAISSTQLRRLLAFSCADSYLPAGVAEYIRRNALYDSMADWKNLTQNELEKVTVRLLEPGRVAHVLGCRDTAVALARHYGAGETAAARAGLLHDITKALDGPLQLTLCQGYGKILDDFSHKYPKTLHALTGSLVAQRIFGESAEVVSAIRWHTTGRADMTLLEKIVYLADYIEPNRTIPGVEKLRALAFTDLDGAIKLGLTMTLMHLSQQNAEVSPHSREALAWLEQENKRGRMPR